MASQPTVTEAPETRRRQRPAAMVRKPKGGEPGGAEPIASASRARPSARPSSAQLLRACLLVFAGFLCVAYLQAGSARAADEAIVCKIETAR